MKGRLSMGADVDLGLAVSALSLRYGQTRTIYDLACFCGCKPQRISQIEQQALRKMRFRLSRDPDLVEALKIMAAK